MYSLLVTYRFPDKDKRDGFYEDVVDNKIGKIVLKEDGCERYEYEIPECDTELLLHEDWEDRKAQQVHIKQPVMNFLKALKMKHKAETIIEELSADDENADELFDSVNVKLKNVLIVVKDIEKALKFYHDVFGFELVLDNDGNMILTDGLVLQAESYWKDFLQKDVNWKNNAGELYFETSDIERFVERLDSLYPEIEYVNKLMTHSWGQTVVRFYDLDGNLIEVGSPA